MNDVQGQRQEAHAYNIYVVRSMMAYNITVVWS